MFTMQNKVTCLALHTLHCDLESLKLVTASSFLLEDSHPCRLKGAYRSRWAGISRNLSVDMARVLGGLLESVCSQIVA